MSASEEVLAERRGAALWITINRPERRNALTEGVLEQIGAAWRSADADPEVRVIVLTGGGERAFCAGADLHAGRNFAFEHERPTTLYADLARTARQAQKPSIARVNGSCMAGGMGLLGMTDLVIAAHSAVFGLPEIRIGLFPMQVCALLNGIVSRRELRHWSLSGERFDSAEALRTGLVNVVVADAELDAAVDRQVRTLALGSPVAMRRGLLALRSIEDLDFDSGLALAEAQIGLTALTEDAREGIAAFNEKRPPRWVIE